MIDNLARMTHFHGVAQNNLNNQPTQLKTHYDKKYKAGWYFMNAQPRPCFTSVLLGEINEYQQRLKHEMDSSQQKNTII